MHYRMGYCTQCDTQVIVRDTNGMFNSFMPNFKQAELVFEDGHKVRIVICANCLASPDLNTIYESLIHAEAQTGESAKETLKAKKNPVKVTEFRL